MPVLPPVTVPVTRGGRAPRPLAVTLRERSAAAIDIERTFATQSSFDPATTDQTFSLVVSDYAIMVFGDPLLRLLRARAPGARLHLQELGIASRAPDFDTMLRTVDGAVFPHGYISGYPSANLYRDEWVVIAAADNTAISTEPTLQELAAAPWLVTHHRPAAFSAPFHRLSAFGLEPRINGAHAARTHLTLRAAIDGALAVKDHRYVRLPAPTFRDYIPIVAAGPRHAAGCTAATGTVATNTGASGASTNPHPPQIRQFLVDMQSELVMRRSGRGGHSATEHLIAAPVRPTRHRGRAIFAQWVIGRRSMTWLAKLVSLPPPSRALTPVPGGSMPRRPGRSSPQPSGSAGL